MIECRIVVLVLLFRSVLLIKPPNNLHLNDTHTNNLYLNDTHMNCYASYNINIRPASNNVLPVREEVNTTSIALARHHIIPFTVLRRFYNELLRRDEARFRRFFEHVLMEAGRSVGLNLNTVESLIRFRSNIDRNQEDLLLGVVLRDMIIQNRQSYQERLARELYVWLPYNIFLGPIPLRRSDDPGDNFEANAHVIVGQPRLQQLRRMQTDMEGYADGRVADPSHVIDEMGDLVRTTQQPYRFIANNWRMRLSDERYAIAVPGVVNDGSYRRVRPDDYCVSSIVAFKLYNASEDFILRERREAPARKTCLVRDEGALYDPYCVNSLDVLRRLVKENIVTLKDGQLKLNNLNDVESEGRPAGTGCRPGLAATSGVAAGAGLAFASCLALGGVYIPLAGWIGCGIGSLAYSLGGLVIGTSVSSALCRP